MLFKIALWFGLRFDFPGLPLCRVFNDAKTEHYTLRRDGLVFIQSVKTGSIDALPITMVSEKLVEKFDDELVKVGHLIKG